MLTYIDVTEPAKKFNLKYTEGLAGVVTKPYYGDDVAEHFILHVYGVYWGSTKSHVELIKGEGHSLLLAFKQLEKNVASYHERVING